MKIKLDKGAVMPTRAHETDAGLDLYALGDRVIFSRDERTTENSVVFDTGVHIQLPPGYYGKIEGKSGLNIHFGIVTLGGVIDEGYTGSIKVKLYNMSNQPVLIQKGQKIAQLVIMPYAAPDLELVDHLDETDRGDAGFGSSGI